MFKQTIPIKRNTKILFFGIDIPAMLIPSSGVNCSMLLVDEVLAPAGLTTGAHHRFGDLRIYSKPHRDKVRVARIIDIVLARGAIARALPSTRLSNSRKLVAQRFRPRLRHDLTFNGVALANIRETRIEKCKDINDLKKLFGHAPFVVYITL